MIEKKYNNYRSRDTAYEKITSFTLMRHGLQNQFLGIHDDILVNQGL